VYELVVAYERADWLAVARCAEVLRLPDSDIAHAYASALKFSSQMSPS
jgi:hypothetical protein